eukprot:COSAG06_NODE_5076_length_3743_cov_21.948957_8_plen_95_part_00
MSALSLVLLSHSNDLCGMSCWFASLTALANDVLPLACVAVYTVRTEPLFNGTYDMDMFTDRALSIVDSHPVRTAQHAPNRTGTTLLTSTSTHQK